jgi:hypothetical protein
LTAKKETMMDQMVGGSPDPDLPKYRSHKTVHALEIESCAEAPDPGDELNPLKQHPGYMLEFVDKAYAPRWVDVSVVSRHMPEKGDFFVVYDDGHESISPRAPFVEGYVKLGTEPPPQPYQPIRVITDHKVGEVNDGLTVSAGDQPGPGGAHHFYMVGNDGIGVAAIRFQKGPLKEAGINGVTHEVLLAVIIDRLKAFQAGPFANAYNAVALSSCQEALGALKARTLERQARGVEGTMQK